jgi:acyl dehydratase
VAGDLLDLADVPVGFAVQTGGSAITESRVAPFAGLSRDLIDLHMDDAFARSLGFPRRVVNGETS